MTDTNEVKTDFDPRAHLAVRLALRPELIEDFAGKKKNPVLTKLYNLLADHEAYVRCYRLPATVAEHQFESNVEVMVQDDRQLKILYGDLFVLAANPKIDIFVRSPDQSPVELTAGSASDDGRKQSYPRWESLIIRHRNLA